MAPSLYDLAPTIALCLVAGLAPLSHLLNAARIVDGRRAKARKRARAARSSAKAAAFLAVYADARSVDAGPSTGRFVVAPVPLRQTRRES